MGPTSCHQDFLILHNRESLSKTSRVQAFGPGTLGFNPLSFDHSAVAPQVRGEGSGALGSLSLPLSELLGADQLCVDRWFALNNGQGQVLLRAQLGVSARHRWAGRGGAGTEGCIIIASSRNRALPSSQRS